MKAIKKRVLTMMLASVIAASALVSCGDKQEEGSSAHSGESSAANSPLKFTVTTVGFGANPEGKLIQNEWLKLCSEKLGRELQPTYDFINIGDYSEKLKIICTGGDIPDLLSYGWGTQSDLIKWGEEGMFEELTQHMDQLPNYKKALDGDKKAPYTVYSESGKLYGFYGMTYQGDMPVTFSNGGAAAIRRDIFEKNNIAIPNTTEEFTDAARVLKKAYPDSYPIILHEEWQQPEDLLFCANHTSSSRYYNGTEFVYGPEEEAYKEALQTMNIWYTEGLISPDFFTHTSEDGTAAVGSGNAYMIPSIWHRYPGSWRISYPDQDWILLPALKNEKYGDPWSFYRGNTSEYNLGASYSVVISGKSKLKNEMLQLMDEQYSPEVIDLICWGVEGTTYQINDQGKKEFIPEFLEDKDKWPELAYGQGSCRAGVFPSPQMTQVNYTQEPIMDIYFNGENHKDYTWDRYFMEEYTVERDIPQDAIIVKPLTTDANEEYANIMTSVETFAKEQKVKFIKGERSFDEWDQYVEELNAMGDIQKAMDIYNAAVVK